MRRKMVKDASAEIKRTCEELDAKIEKKKARVEAAREKYNSEVEDLKALMDKRESLRKEKLLDALMKSSKSEDEIIRFLTEEEN